MTALCRTRPADWWDTYDGGARLALALCSVCPALADCGRGREYGVIRAGVAWNDLGAPAGLCGCGYPLPLDRYDRERAACVRCEPPNNVRVVTGRSAEVFRLVAAGLSYAEVGRRVGISKSMVGKYMSRRRCPQAVSTEEDAA